MITILSLAVNDEWTNKLEEIMGHLQYQVSWTVNDYRLVNQLQAVEQSVVILPYTGSYDIYSLCSTISKKVSSTSTILVFSSEEICGYEESFTSRRWRCYFPVFPFTKNSRGHTICD